MLVTGKVTGQLQVYVCHDGALEVYVDGKDIKEALGIDTSSMWFDFGYMSMAISRKPGKQTEARPNDFGQFEIPF